MRSSFALVAAAFVSEATTFLIPPQVHDEVEAVKAQIESFIGHGVHSFELDCPNCPFAGVDENELVWEKDVESRIHLEFRIDDNQRLSINEVPVFPLDLPTPLTIVAQQVRASDLARTAPIPLGQAIEVYPEHVDEADPSKRLIAATFTILDLKGIPVKVDTVKLSLLEYISDDQTKLRIVKSTTIPFEETPGHATCEGATKWSLCRVKAIISARIQALVAAAKMHADAAKGWMQKPKGGCHGRKFGHAQEGQHGEHSEGQREGHHHGHHHEFHHGMHRFGHILHQTLRFFVVPALLGVVGGLMASAVGMLVGQLIVYMWLRFHRNGERGPIRHGDVVLIVDDEKGGLLAENGEAPPAYQDDKAVVGNEKN